MMTELKNLLIKRHGAILIIVFLLVKGVLFFYNYQCEEAMFSFVFTPDTAAYEKYTDMYEGALTEADVQNIKKLVDYTSNASSAMGNAYVEYVNGESCYEDYCRAVNKFSQLSAEHKKGMQQLGEQVDYIEQDLDNRWLLDTRGWICLLRNQSLDVVLVMLILLVSAQTFCNDYSSDMDELLLTTCKGRKILARNKFLTTVSLCGLVSVLFSTLEYIVIFIRQGLPCPNAPIQSIEAFSDSTTGFTLIGAFVFAALLKALGSILFSTIVLALSVILRRPLPVISIAVSLILIPYLALQNEWTKLYVLPLGLFMSNGYLRTDEILSNAVEELIAFKGVSKSELLLIIAFAVVLIASLYIVTQNVYLHRRLLRRRKR